MEPERSRTRLASRCGSEGSSCQKRTKSWSFSMPSIENPSHSSQNCRSGFTLDAFLCNIERSLFFSSCMQLVSDNEVYREVDCCAPRRRFSVITRYCSISESIELHLSRRDDSWRLKAATESSSSCRSSFSFSNSERAVSHCSQAWMVNSLTCN